MNRKIVLVATPLLAFVLGIGVFMSFKDIHSKQTPTANGTIDNTISDYISALSDGNRNEVNKYLAGIAETNFSRFPSSELKPETLEDNIISVQSSGPIASAQVEVTSASQDQVQSFTLFNKNGHWVIVDIQYANWSLEDVRTHQTPDSSIQSVVTDFIQQSAAGNIKGAINDLTGEAYNETSDFAQGNVKQPPVSIGSIKFLNSVQWNSTHCGIEAIYTSSFSGKTLSHDEWFSLVQVEGVWKIEEVLSV